MDYRFVHLNSSGKAASGEDWSCASDIEAIERAQQEVPSFGAELWRGDRRLGVLAGPMSGAHMKASPAKTKH
jgi:hypothetical protein